MATLFLDFENGNDANSGADFGNRFKTMTSGATAARTAPGDTIRMMMSPVPTSIGMATWAEFNGTAIPATKNIGSVSSASPPVITINSHGYVNGDLLQVTGQTGNRLINGIWEIQNITGNTFELKGCPGATGGTATGTVRLYNQQAVKLATACNKTITQCEVAWTAAANVTASLSTTRKQGDSSASLAIAAGFTTGKAAYYPLPATLDLSAYQQVTFHIRVTAAIPNGTTLSLRLCSDTTGDTSVDTIAIPAVPGLNRWTSFTVDKGSVLGNSIASIALYADADPGTITVLLDNIAAVKAVSADDSLGLQSLIGVATTGIVFYPLASIEETVLSLDAGPEWLCGSARHMGQVGHIGSVPTYKRECIKLAPQSSGVDPGLVMNEAGSSGSLIHFSGGWDAAGMTTQDGETWIDCRNGYASGFGLRGFCKISKVGIVRASNGLYEFNNMTGAVIEDVSSVGNANSGMSFGNQISDVTFSGSNYFCNNYQHGLVIGSGQSPILRVAFGSSIKKANGNGGARDGSYYGLLFNAGVGWTAGIIEQLCANYGGGMMLAGAVTDFVIDEISRLSDTHNGYGIIFSAADRITIGYIGDTNHNLAALQVNGLVSEIRILRGSSSLHSQGSFRSDTGSAGDVHLRRWTSTDSVAASLAGRARFHVDRWGDTVGDHRSFSIQGEVRSESSVRHTASGIAWRLAPTSTVHTTSADPLMKRIARLAVKASALVTCKAWVRRDNTGAVIGILLRKNQLTGIASDVSATITAAADTWEELTITFTPTEAGVVELHAFAYGGSTFLTYIDDLTLSQA